MVWKVTTKAKEMVDLGTHMYVLCATNEQMEDWAWSS